MSSINLAELHEFLKTHPAVIEKCEIQSSYKNAALTTQTIEMGDDAAAIPDQDGYLLFAGEAMLPEFIRKDPWFAGYCAVMVNISDIAAMGGKPIAIVDLLWKSDKELYEQLWQGMVDASLAYSVPIVGGHTSNLSPVTLLGAAILGRAKKILTSSSAIAGEELLMAIDLKGDWYGDNPFWNCSTNTEKEKLQTDIQLLSSIAEADLSTCAKDISNGGIFGTLMMMLNCSQVGATVDIDKIPIPRKVDDYKRWCIAFPSYGYLLTCSPDNRESIVEIFNSQDIVCQKIGSITAKQNLKLITKHEEQLLWQKGFMV